MKYNYIIEEFTHHSGVKTYKPFLVETMFFGLKTKKYPLIVKEQTNKHLPYRYIFYNFKELENLGDYIALAWSPTTDIDFVNELIAQHKLWMESEEKSKVVSKKIIKK